MATTNTTKRTEALLSRREVEGLIAEGKSIIIVDQKVLKVDPWMKYHPGGDKAIRHMIGRDATDEVNALVYLFRYRGDLVNIWKQSSLIRSTEADGKISYRSCRRAMDKLRAADSGREIQASY
jgi:hypothetical protein